MLGQEGLFRLKLGHVLDSSLDSSTVKAWFMFIYSTCCVPTLNMVYSMQGNLAGGCIKLNASATPFQSCSMLCDPGLIVIHARYLQSASL